MGKPFASELLKIPDTLAWANQVDVNPLTEFFLQCQYAPLVSIGTGGSFTAAELLRLLFEARGGIAISHTPLSFLQSNADLRGANLVLFTAGGNNKDVLEAWRVAVEREVRRILVICGSPTSKIAALAKRTLFVGLSDGARIDGFRRANAGMIDNEQIILGYEISDEKWKDIYEELCNRTGDPKARFELVFLIDDFTGSGKTLLRIEDKKWKGKLTKFAKSIKRHSKLFAIDYDIVIHHYVATKQAMKHLSEFIKQFNALYPQLMFVQFFHFRVIIRSYLICWLRNSVKI